MKAVMPMCCYEPLKPTRAAPPSLRLIKWSKEKEMRGTGLYTYEYLSCVGILASSYL